MLHRRDGSWLHLLDSEWLPLTSQQPIASRNLKLGGPNLRVWCTAAPAGTSSQSMVTHNLRTADELLRPTRFVFVDHAERTGASNQTPAVYTYSC